MLRFVPDERGRRHIWLDPEKIPERLKLAFIAAEDKRFYSHSGVDPLAVIRAARDNLEAGRIVSGASTITQQLARLVAPRRRSFYGKLVEMARAVRLEARLSKAEILGLYLNRAPLGHNLIGVEAAARTYFGCSATELSLAQAAVLASLPAAPGRLSPYGGHVAELMAKKDRVLKRMHALGFIDAENLAAARAEEIAFVPRRFPMEAPHLVDMLLAKGEGTPWGEVRTTVDLTLQHRLERILTAHRQRLRAGGARQAAAVILANSGSRGGPEVLALAGSLAYGPQDGGFVNGALARRSAGSSLKPFLYALALEAGYTAADVLEDVARRYRSPGGDYLPANFDRRSYGPVSLRAALGNSFNLSAVYLLRLIGPGPFHDVLTQLGLLERSGPGPERYGLGLAVGNAEVRLIDLAAAFAALANGGRYAPPRLLADRPPVPARRVFSPQAAFIITDILSDPAARAITFAGSPLAPGLRAAVKTGTSTRYRDLWCVAYTPAYTVAVWAGNFDGRPTAGLSGSSGAGPIAADILAELHRFSPPRRPAPPVGVGRAKVCGVSGLKPTAHCPHVREEYFIAGTEPSRECDYHRPTGWTHRLPTPFAGWLHARNLKGAAGRYRLAGFVEDLDRVFDGRSEAGTEMQVYAGDRVSLGRPPRHPRPAAGSLSDPAGPVIITYPLPGDRFVLDAGGRQPRITLQARCTRPTERLTWFIDGRQQATTGPPYQLAWRLSPGRHRIAAVTPGGLGDAVEITVE